MSKRCYRHSQTAALAAFGLLVAACSGGSGGGGSNGTATLTVSVMDTPAAAVDNVTEVNVEINALWLKGAGSAARQLTMSQTPMTVNLAALTTDKNAALLIDAQPIEPGDYEWLEMDVNADFDGKFDSYVTTTTGGQEELRVPPGRVRLVGGFTVAANQALQLLLDWNLRKGLVRPQGQPGFFLKPAIRVIDVTELGVLRGTVALTTLNATTATVKAVGTTPSDTTGDANGCLADDPNIDVGNAVYVFAGDNITPDDIDAMDPEPVTVIPVEPNAAGEYVYRTAIAPGTYTIAFTCQAGLDDPDKSDDLKFVAPVTRTITADAEVIVDF